jgi:hypothetical protein
MKRDVRPPGWSEYEAIASIIDGVDAVTKEYERIWGVGRLDLLVSNELREKFRKQQKRFNDAITDHNLESVKKSGDAFKRAWHVLGNAAVDAGHFPLRPEVWEISMPDGSVAAFVRTNAEQANITREGRYLQVWTMEEIARVIAKFPEVAIAKQTFPGATVQSVKNKNTWKVEDEQIPF